MRLTSWGKVRAARESRQKIAEMTPPQLFESRFPHKDYSRDTTFSTLNNFCCIIDFYLWPPITEKPSRRAADNVECSI